MITGRPNPTNSARSTVDTTGRAYAGSQKQIQIYVNSLPDVLNATIAGAFGDAFPVDCTVQWVSPLAKDGYREYRDAEFLRILGIEPHSAALSQFWPTGGPRWDALARIEEGQGFVGCILVEAKSHVAECCQADTGAKGNSLRLIQNSLESAKRWLGVPQETAWTGFACPDECLYQYANRLAHLYFLREVLDIDAFLVNIHFMDDPYHPTDLNTWKQAISGIHTELGLTNMPDCFASVFLPAIRALVGGK